ncbi:acetyl-CoA carboxylase subunit beta [Halomonas sp. MCCC 1A11036]|uniref:Acetyl-CoA carboxylase subunit beta n=1 Tax=Billgrantia zhangzhouensis TaxID=2733481 RepID=A0ABS9ADL7_9GAMM|nr:SPOR domain-containing protein [Halomonas zhangzhouensis]MCE8019822.1 acetyl-CoA carboxylase subunit beta [Halomonas zhangzhouensis]
MKYGMRERISGAIILIALAVIFVPMLFDEPAPRDERPQPMLTIEQPVPVERRNVPDPQPPESLGEIRTPETSPARMEPQPPLEDVEPDPGEAARVETAPAVAVQPGTADSDSEQPSAPAETARQDPIADLAQAASERLESNQPASSSPEPERQTAAVSASPGGEWAVQVGSFGEAGNAERLLVRLQEQGFPAYSRQRDNNMTTVYVGPFDSSEAGERAMNAVKERINQQGLLVRVRD